jgi:hypothetical protein
MSHPRLCPSRPLPMTTFISGRGQPHPGTLETHAPPSPLPIDPMRPGDSEALLYSLDLFHHGYYWEAHEEWEALWHAAGRQGPVAELLKGLIKLAAAGVKLRQGIPEGVRSHGQRARIHVDGLRAEHGERFCGFDLPALAAFADEAAGLADEAPAHKAAAGSDDVVVVFRRPLPFAIGRP